MGIAIGYILTYGYIFLLIFVGGYIGKLVTIEVSRKVTHMLLFLVWVLISYFFKNTIHQIIIPVSFIVINLIAYKFSLYKGIDREGYNHPGTIYFAIAISIILVFSYFYPEYYIYSGIAVFCLTFGDGFAALLGQSFKTNIYLEKHKTINGFIGCFIFATISLILFKYAFFNELQIENILLLGLITAILELVEEGLDNFSITLGIFFISYYLVKNDSNFGIYLSVGVLIFGIVYFSKLITYYGAILSATLVTLFGYYGNYYCLIFLLSCYFVSVIIGIIRKLLKANVSDIVCKNNQKDGIQIFVNSIFAFIAIYLNKLFDNEIFLIISLIIIGANLVDSIASDVGTLSKHKAFDIYHFKFIDKGLSGGISILGTISSMVSALCLSISIVFIFKMSYIYILIVFALIMLDTVVDTLFGSLLQAKYKCVKCDLITEHKVHCNEKCELVSGYKIINNDTVNFLSSFIVFCISLATFLII